MARLTHHTRRTDPQHSWRRDLWVYWRCLRLQIRSAMSLRGAFIVQVLGMVMNNTALIVAWLFFFHQFGTVNGWSGRELIGLMGINMLIFGIVMLLSVGVLDLPRHVDSGSLDSHLTKPSPLVLQLAGSNIDPTTFGDALLGLGIVCWYLIVSDISLVAFLPFMLALMVGVVIFWCWSVLLPNILSFYLYDSTRISRYIGMLFLDTGLYPTGVLTGALRMILLTVVPGLFIGAVPVQVVHRFDWQLALVGVGVAAFWLVVSLWLFRRAVQRYESSNLVGAR